LSVYTVVTRLGIVKKLHVDEPGYGGERPAHLKRRDSHKPLKDALRNLAKPVLVPVQSKAESSEAKVDPG
jgi:hypothetical protein